LTADSSPAYVAPMRILELDTRPSREIAEYGSSGVRAWYLARGDGVNVVRLEIRPGGRLGRHPAGVSQLFAVVSGAGWVSGRDGKRQPVAAGQAVVWEAGEEHESGADATVMVAVIVQAGGLAPSDAPD
jgi:quercetin dioxygenase-like cupin family protein